MTITQVVHPIVAAVAKLDDLLGLLRIWNSTNAAQHVFLRDHYTACSDLDMIPEIDSIAGREAAVINAWLAARGYSIALDPFRPTEVGAAAALKLRETWNNAGTETTLVAPGQPKAQYPAAHFAEEAVRHFVVPRHEHPVARLEAENGDLAYLTMFHDEGPATPFHLINVVMEMRQALRETREYGTLTFPMSDLDVETPLSWLLRMWTYDQEGEYTFISQAKQQSRLKLNHLGALMESAVAVGAMRGVARVKTPHVINRPFLYWCMRPGVRLPVFVAHITPESWKDPGDF